MRGTRTACAAIVWLCFTGAAPARAEPARWPTSGPTIRLGSAVGWSEFDDGGVSTLGGQAAVGHQLGPVTLEVQYDAAVMFSSLEAQEGNQVRGALERYGVNARAHFLRLGLPRSSDPSSVLRLYGEAGAGQQRGRWATGHGFRRNDLAFGGGWVLDYRMRPRPGASLGRLALRLAVPHGPGIRGRGGHLRCKRQGLPAAHARAEHRPRPAGQLLAGRALVTLRTRERLTRAGARTRCRRPRPAARRCRTRDRAVPPPRPPPRRGRSRHRFLPAPASRSIHCARSLRPAADLPPARGGAAWFLNLCPAAPAHPPGYPQPGTDRAFASRPGAVPGSRESARLHRGALVPGARSSWPAILDRFHPGPRS